MKVAITGAAGHLGAALLQELSNRKIPVRALIREDYRPCKDLPVELVKGDMLQPGVLKTLMRNCDTVIHCAALISVNGDPKGHVHRTNVVGTQLVMNSALEQGIKRCIHISSIHAYQQEPSLEILDENRKTVNEKAFAYDRSKLEGQKIALSANNSGMEVIVLNPTSIIGPFDHKPSLMGQVIIDLYTGHLPFIIRGGFDFCDCRDVAKAVVNATVMGNPGETYLLAGKWYAIDQLARFVRQVSAKKINPVVLSPMLARLGLPFIKMIAALRNKEPLYTVEALDALTKGNRMISSEKAQTALHYTSRPFEETIYDTIHWFKNNGYLDQN